MSDVDIALATARDAARDGPLEITPAVEAGQAWTVAHVDNVWPVHRDVIAIDPSTDPVTDRIPFADQSLRA